MINNRQQSGRRRGRGGQNGQRPQNGRPELGNRIDNRARGNAPQLLEKYKTLARDAQQAGDRVLAEYYFQFADHYFRVLAESRARYEEANPNRPRQDYAEQEEQFDEDGNEIEREFDARPSQQVSQEQAPRQYRDSQTREDRPRDDRPRDDRSREDRAQRDDRPREDRPQRDERPRDNQNRDNQNRGNQHRDNPNRDSPNRDSQHRDSQSRDSQGRDDRPVRQDREARPERSSEDRPPRQDRYQREDRPRQDRSRNAAPRAQGNGAVSDDDSGHSDALPFDVLPPAIGPALSVAVMEPVTGVEGEPIAVPKKRGRPKKVVEATDGE